MIDFMYNCLQDTLKNITIEHGKGIFYSTKVNVLHVVENLTKDLSECGFIKNNWPTNC